MAKFRLGGRRFVVVGISQTGGPPGSGQFRNEISRIINWITHAVIKRFATKGCGKTIRALRHGARAIVTGQIYDTGIV